MMPAPAIRSFLAVLIVTVTACSGRPSSAPSTGVAQSVVVVVSPDKADLATGATQRFAADVTGTADTGVTWSIPEGGGCGSVSTSGDYTAPPGSATCHVVATSHADPGSQASATINVRPSTGAGPLVTITPGAATLDACGTASFSATVSNTSNTAVTWTIAEAGGGSVSGGRYVAPNTPGTYHVVATSQTDASRTAQATVTVGAERLLSVSVTPGSTQVAPSGTVVLAATVTTSCGAFAAQ